MGDDQLREPKPESLEAKFKLMTLLPFDKRAKRKHILVYGFVLDWFHSKYGNALASSRHVLSELKERDPFGQGLYMGDVHGALTDLVSWGYLSREKGAGRRASRYIPVWSKFDSVRKSMNITDHEISARETPNNSVLESPNATADSVLKISELRPSYRDPGTDPGTRREGIDPAPASPPPGPGLEGRPGAVRAGDGFEELWLAYGHRQKKAEARAAYVKLSPDDDLHARMVEAAGQWRSAWEAQGRADAPRFTLARWLEREDYDCSPPTAYTPKSRSKARPTNAANQNVLAPSGSRRAIITKSHVDEGGGHQKLHMTLLDLDDGTEWDHSITISSSNTERQCVGQAELGELISAVGKPSVNDSEELHHIPFIVKVSGRNHNYINIGKAA
ncbi:hypothetical protein [Rhizobium mayense]|uniref:hypothetical protein n=1 Tax=Rhizobium mayense TaxID=1312184 RepID=UPI00398C3FA5